MPVSGEHRTFVSGGVSMNQNYTRTITLYNRIQCRQTATDKKEHWNRTVLHNCFWKSQVNTGFNGTQASVQNTYVVRIPEDEQVSFLCRICKGSGGALYMLPRDDLVDPMGNAAKRSHGTAGHTAAQVLNQYASRMHLK